MGSVLLFRFGGLVLFLVPGYGEEGLQLTLTPDNPIVTSGSALTLTCRVTQDPTVGRPLCKMTLLKSELPSSIPLAEVTYNTSARLLINRPLWYVGGTVLQGVVGITIVNVTTGDGGNYTCDVMSGNGADTDSCAVENLGRNFSHSVSESVDVLQASADESRKGSAYEPISVRLSIAPEHLSLPFKHSVKVSCDLPGLTADVELTVCGMTLYTLDKAGSRSGPGAGNVSEPMGRTTKSTPHRTIIAQAHAGDTPTVRINRTDRAVWGGVASMTLIIRTVTCADDGTYGCDVTYIRGRRGSEEEAAKACVGAEKGRELSEKELLRSSAEGRLRVDVPLREVTLNATINGTSDKDRELTLTCFAQTTEKIDRWIWEVERGHGWHAVNPLTHDVSSDVIKAGTSSCRISYSGDAIGDVGSSVRHSGEKWEDRRRYRCYVVINHIKLLDKAAVYLFNQSELSAKDEPGLNKSRSMIVHRGGAEDSGTVKDTADEHDTSSRGVTYETLLPSILGVATIVAAAVVTYYTCYRPRLAQPPQDSKHHKPITEPFQLQVLRHPRIDFDDLVSRTGVYDDDSDYGTGGHDHATKRGVGGFDEEPEHDIVSYDDEFELVAGGGGDDEAERLVVGSDDGAPPPSGDLDQDVQSEDAASLLAGEDPYQTAPTFPEEPPASEVTSVASQKSAASSPASSILDERAEEGKAVEEEQEDRAEVKGEGGHQVETTEGKVGTGHGPQDQLRLQSAQKPASTVISATSGVATSDVSIASSVGSEKSAKDTDVSSLVPEEPSRDWTLE